MPSSVGADRDTTPVSAAVADSRSVTEAGARVLFIGLDPEAMDYSDSALPPGLTSAKIAAGIEASLADMKARGWKAAFCSIAVDHRAETMIAEALTDNWDCIVVGGGIRIPPQNLCLFERVIDAIRRGAPGTPIAFNNTPADTADAAKRWLAKG